MRNGNNMKMCLLLIMLIISNAFCFKCCCHKERWGIKDVKGVVMDGSGKEVRKEALKRNFCAF